MQQVPCPTHFGATAQRGADLAPHILVTFMEVCGKRKKSFFVLFVELVKAFDRVIRELVFGIPPRVTDVSKHLFDLGLTVSQLNFVTSFIARHGSLFKVIGVHPRVVSVGVLSTRIFVGHERVAGICHHRDWRKTWMCLREYGFQHTIRTGPHGIER